MTTTYRDARSTIGTPRPAGPRAACIHCGADAGIGTVCQLCAAEILVGWKAHDAAEPRVGGVSRECGLGKHWRCDGRACWCECHPVPAADKPKPRADYVPFDVADVVDWEAWLDALNHRTALELPAGDAAGEVAARAAAMGEADPFI